MNFKKTKFKGLIVFKGKRFMDTRGYFREILKEKILPKKSMLFWCLSKSKKNVLRGLHLQKIDQQEKFVSVIKGKILDVVVDLRKNSKTFGKNYKIILSEQNCKSVFIPKGFAHGFLGMDNENIITVIKRPIIIYFKLSDFFKVFIVRIEANPVIKNRKKGIDSIVCKL